MTMGMKAAAALALLLFPAAAGAQTCRTSQVTGTIVCDNGATARTSPVTGTTTFSDGRTARTSPVTGNVRFSDGTSFRAGRVERGSPRPQVPATVPTVDAANAGEGFVAAAVESVPRPAVGKRRGKRRPTR